MNALVVGAGNIGAGIALNLIGDGYEVDIADRSRDSLNKIRDRIPKIRTMEFDAMDHASYSILGNYDITMSALPGSIGMTFLKNAVKTGNKIVDVSYTPEDPYQLNSIAENSGSIIIPDMGFAPGLTNAIVGYFVRDLDIVENVRIYVGGIPDHQVPPIDYTITWSIEGLIDEYTRPVNIVKDGKKTQVPPLSGIDMLSIGTYDNLESFYTDGLRSLIRNIACTGEMFEKTVRYKGHAEKMAAIRDLGYFSSDRIPGCNLSMFEISERLLLKTLFRPDVHDVALMRVEVDGERSGRKLKRTAEMELHYSDELKRTAMDLATSLPASITGEYLMNRNVSMSGVIFPEVLSRTQGYFDQLIKNLIRNKINLRITES